MNLSDLTMQATMLEKELLKMEEVINKFKNIIDLSDKFKKLNLEIILKYDITATGPMAVNNRKTLSENTKNYYNNFLQLTREVNFMNSYFILASIKDKFEYFNVSEFTDDFIECTKMIHAFTSSKKKNDMVLFVSAEYEMRKLINGYESIILRIDQVRKIGDTLIGPKHEEDLKIRLLTETNEVSNLTENLMLINSIYNDINLLIGDEAETLKYKRAESGTFEIDLTGCLKTLSALFPILHFSYKIYSENFSWKAKQEKQLGDIKVRGEYLKLMKEENELKINNEEQIKDILGNLDDNIKKFYQNNPCIQINDKKVGLEQLIGQDIPMELLKTSDEEISDNINQN